MTFASLGVSEMIVRAVGEREQIIFPPVQTKTIPAVSTVRDVTVPVNALGVRPASLRHGALWTGAGLTLNSPSSDVALQTDEAEPGRLQAPVLANPENTGTPVMSVPLLPGISVSADPSGSDNRNAKFFGMIE